MSYRNDYNPSESESKTSDSDYSSNQVLPPKFQMNNSDKQVLQRLIRMRDKKSGKDPSKSTHWNFWEAVSSL